MTITLDRHLREQIEYISQDFPITYFHDEIIDLPDRKGPIHWHPEFEIVTAETGVLDYQVGEDHILLNAGDSIFVNSNILHGIRQISGDIPDPMPGIVFPGTFIAPEGSLIYQKYIQKLSSCDCLPYIVFRKGDHEEIHAAVQHVYDLLDEGGPQFELGILQELISIFSYIDRHLADWPAARVFRVQLHAQVRIQQMLSFIYDHYAENINLADIASAASISRSEAGRCFAVYLRTSPIDFLVRYRLQRAHALLEDTTLTIQEIGHACGFHSTSYFTRRFRSFFGYPPGMGRKLGK